MAKRRIDVARVPGSKTDWAPVKPKPRAPRSAADHTLAVAYVNVAVALAGIEHQLEQLTDVIRQMAPHADHRTRRGAVGHLPRERKPRP